MNAGYLGDQMDRKAESLLHKAWEANAASLASGLATTCIACNMELWLEIVALHITQGAAKEEILQSLSIVQRAAT